VDDGTFQIDGMGRIWRTKMRKGLKKGGSHVITISPRRAEHRTPGGYLQIRVSMPSGERVYACAHRLVWQHFHGEIPDGLCINHKNGDKGDNHPRNLELVSYSENMKHAFRVGLCNQDGERNPTATLTNEKAREIRELFAQGELKQGEIADRMQIPFQQVSAVIRGKIYTDAGGPIDNSDHRNCFSSQRDPVTGQFIKSDDTNGKVWDQMPEVR
jgi:hypothetical protein